MEPALVLTARKDSNPRFSIYSYLTYVFISIWTHFTAFSETVVTSAAAKLLDQLSASAPAEEATPKEIIVEKNDPVSFQHTIFMT